MSKNPLDLYEQASAWTLSKVQGAAKQLDAATPCDGWTVRDLLSHMIETQHYFVGAAKGDEVKPPSGDPTETLGADPVRDFEHNREETIRTFGAEGVIERTGPSLGIAFSDQLLHGWDLAKATGQDTTMPEGLAEAAFEMVHGSFTDEQRKGVFKPEVDAPKGASAQDKLLAYTGRDPS